ncbi:MAG: tetratricopeptide repeat protein [Bacteroidota bacterium]
MTPELWYRVEAAFEEALPLSETQRSTVLDKLDADVRPHVERLLAAHDTDPAYLDTPIVDIEPEHEPDVGDFIGPYRLTALIGEGGMGRVFAATRDDETLRQDVAIKLVRRGVFAAEAQQRFAEECRILATLTHPNIARLYTADTTPAGRLYLVMERIDGEPITHYADAHRLGFEDRLRSLIQVCEAVQYAHRQLIVHRDIKPDNVLVDTEGQVHLVDFGVATSLGEHADDTERLRRLTPAYAAPEQLLGRRVSASTDVYALGLLLYEVVAGVPARTRTEPTHEALKRLADTVPLPLAEAGIDQPWSRELRDDLSVVAQKALAKRPDQRYATAGELALDLQRLLERRPVHARPRTNGYVAQRFVQRNRVTVGLAATALLAVLAGLGVTLWQNQQIRAQSAVLETERDAAEQVNQFLVELFDAADPAQADSLRPRDLLERGVDRIANDLEGQPEVRGRMLTTMSRAYTELGEPERALVLLDSALAQFNRASNPDPIAHTYAQLRAGVVLRRLGRLGEAEAMIRPALEQRLAIGAAPGEEAYARMRLGRVLDDQGQLEAALGEFTSARRLYTEPPADSAGVAAALVELANVNRTLNRLDDAERQFDEAIRIRQALHPRGHPRIAHALSDYAILLNERGETDAEVRIRRTLLGEYRAAYGPEHPYTATAHYNLGASLYAAEAFGEAGQHVAEAIAIRKQLLGPDHPRVANGLLYLGAIRHRQGQFSAADSAYAEALPMLISRLGADHFNTHAARQLIAELRLDQGRPTEAIPFLEAAIARFDAQLDTPHRRTAKCAGNLARAYLAVGDTLAARPWQERSARERAALAPAPA